MNTSNSELAQKSRGAIVIYTLKAYAMKNAIIPTIPNSPIVAECVHRNASTPTIRAILQRKRKAVIHPIIHKI